MRLRIFLQVGPMSFTWTRIAATGAAEGGRRRHSLLEVMIQAAGRADTTAGTSRLASTSAGLRGSKALGIAFEIIL